MAIAPPPTQATNGELVRWAFEQINAHDVTPLKALWTPETVEHFRDRTVRGADEIERYFGDLFAAVPDFRLEIRTLVEQGDDVFVLWRLTGTHTGGPWTGVEATGARIELDGMDHFVIRDGKVVSNTVVYDQMAVGRAMGVLPPDGSAADRALKAAFNAKTRLAAAIRQRRG